MITSYISSRFGDINQDMLKNQKTQPPVEEPIRQYETGRPVQQPPVKSSGNFRSYQTEMPPYSPPPEVPYSRPVDAPPPAYLGGRIFTPYTGSRGTMGAPKSRKDFLGQPQEYRAKQMNNQWDSPFQRFY